MKGGTGIFYLDINSRAFSCAFIPLQTRTLPPENRNIFLSDGIHIIQSATNISILSDSNAASYFYFDLEGKGWLPTGVPAMIKTWNWGACVSEHYFFELKVSLTKLRSAETFCQLCLLLDEIEGSQLLFSILVVAIMLTTSSQLQHPRLAPPST